MNTYNLTLRSDGRVILSVSGLTTDPVLQTITASDWVSARNKVKTAEIYDSQGMGWFQR